MFTLANTFGERLKEERLKLGLTQEELSTKMGVRPLTIIQYEKCKSSPSIKFIYTLMDLGFDIVYLLTATANPYAEEFSPELLKEIAYVMDQIELEIIGKPLDSEARVKLTLLMLKQYAKEPGERPVVPFGFQSILKDLSKAKS